MVHLITSFNLLATLLLVQPRIYKWGNEWIESSPAEKDLGGISG